MSDEPRVKVTDKRMFTPEGELREEYSFLEQEASRRAREQSSSERTAPPEPSGRSETSEPERAAPPRAAGPETPGASAAGRPPVELPVTPGAGPAPSFLDLVSLLAEPAVLYLGDAQLPDGSTQEDLPMARLHIDLLDVLRQKTAGNVTAQEAAILEDMLYRLRVRYVQKRG